MSFTEKSPPLDNLSTFAVLNAEEIPVVKDIDDPNINETITDYDCSLPVSSLGVIDPNPENATLVLDKPSLEKPSNQSDKQPSISIENLSTKSLPAIRSSMDAECEAFCRHINTILSSEKFPNLVQKNYLPLEVDNFFNGLKNGVILAHLLYSIQPNLISIQSISLGAEATSRSYKVLHNINENLRLVLDAAKQLGTIHLVNIGTEDILSGNKRIILGLVWQLIRSWYLIGVNCIIETLPNKEGNTTNEKEISAESILIRWINDAVDLDQPISNLGTDLHDCIVYAKILDVVLENKTNLLAESIEAEPDIEKRSSILIEALSPLLTYVRAEDISDPRLNLCIVADLFKLAQSQIKTSVEQVKLTRAEISGWEATLEAERELYASQLASLSEQHSNEVHELQEEIKALQIELSEKSKVWEEQTDAVAIAISSLATRITQISPEGQIDMLPLSRLLQTQTSQLELISYCQTQLDRVEAHQSQLLEEKAKLCTTISLNRHINELMSSRVREFTFEFAEKKKAAASSKGKNASLKSKIFSWTSGTHSPNSTMSISGVSPLSQNTQN